MVNLKIHKVHQVGKNEKSMKISHTYNLFFSNPFLSPQVFVFIPKTKKYRLYLRISFEFIPETKKFCL